jgi:hypothetical protein
MLVAGVLALAANPIIALEVVVLAMDLTRLGRKVTDLQRPPAIVGSIAVS